VSPISGLSTPSSYHNIHNPLLLPALHLPKYLAPQRKEKKEKTGEIKCHFLLYIIKEKE
jgi:hypothetical protein